LKKLVEKAEADLARENAKLDNEAMCARAPAEKVEEWRALHAAAAARATRYREQLRQLG
jgi:valyl-tRNA synthetase